MSMLLAIIRLIRPRQWVKNAFVVAPLFFTPEAMTRGGITAVAIAVAAFSCIASAIYVINDWADREADRQHPIKRNRPLAAGTVSLPAAAATIAVLLAIAAALATLLPLRFTYVVATYFVLNVAYSQFLKHVSLLDVLIISVGFVLRIMAGSAAIGVDTTVWIIVCAFLLALFMALAKRRDDLVKALSSSHRTSLKGYNLAFIDQSLTMVMGSLLVSYLIYTTDSAVIAKFGTNKLYLTAPFVAAGVLRYLQITLVEEDSGSPTDVVLTDKFLIATVAGWVATFAILIYG
jgi:decaprenyl-phosphate phosphoribosyltransferase